MVILIAKKFPSSITVTLLLSLGTGNQCMTNLSLFLSTFSVFPEHDSEQTLLCKETGGEAASSVMNETVPDIMKKGV